jgi:hypothetical protein
MLLQSNPTPLRIGYIGPTKMDPKPA